MSMSEYAFGLTTVSCMSMARIQLCLSCLGQGDKDITWVGSQTVKQPAIRSRELAIGYERVRVCWS